MSEQTSIFKHRTFSEGSEIMTEKCRTPVEIEVEGIGELKTNNSDLLKGFQRQNEIYSFCMQKVISGLEASSQDLA